MTALIGPIARADSALAQVHPLAKLGAATAVMLALLPTVDPVTPAILLAVTLGLLPTTGIRFGALLRRTWPILLGAASVALANALYGDGGGSVVIDVGPLELTAGDVSSGATLGLRLIAIALPGVLAFATTDPTDLADALVQQLRLPARFAVGALAALRLVPLLGADWDAIRRARRSRGMAAGRNPARATGIFASQVFTLLVAAIRRASRLATAMDARGFDSGIARTNARGSVLRQRDWLYVAAALAVCAAATSVSVAVGAWSPIFIGG